MNNSLSIWKKLHRQAVQLAQAEPMLSSHYHQHIINHDDFASALACHLAAQLGNESVSSSTLEYLFLSILTENSDIIESALQDMEAEARAAIAERQKQYEDLMAQAQQFEATSTQ